jgi:selenocysteine-specific elongation factor
VTAKNFILATAGHVDHGKSALVKALTGTDPDRLPEEKARGITIDLGFAKLILDRPNQEQFRVGIVDVPGHEDFVRNMITGVGSINLALLVVAADDGWMPQTEEHLQILIYLGVERIVVGLSKSDLGKIDIVSEQIREKLRDTPFANCPIVPTSTRTGDGLERLKHALCSEFASISPPRDIGRPRLFVDRAFSLHGIGTVVTGTLTGGQIRRGQTALVQPHNHIVRIRSIQSHGRDVDVAGPGMRTAINLPDVALATDSIRRGDVIATDDLGPATSTTDVVLEKSPRLNRTARAGRPLKNGSSVYLHFGTTRVAARVAFLEKTSLEGGECAIAQLRLESPIVAVLGDRFVVRDPSEQSTIAGGTVLDPDGNRENFHTAAQTEFLKARASAPDDIDCCVESELARSGFAEVKSLLRKSHFGSDEIVAALSRLQKRGKVIVRGELAAEAAGWRNLIRRASALIDRAHEQHPEQRGLGLAELRAGLDLQSDQLFETLITGLCELDFTRTGETIARMAHRASLPPEMQSAAEKIWAALLTNPFDPPGRKELAQDRHSQQALRFLIEQGDIVELSSEIVVGREAAEQMRNAAADFISTQGPATASQLRQQIGTSRRIIIPFLEYLDRAGVTQRHGDSRQLRKPKSAAVARP